MKRIFALLLALAMLLSFAACDRGGDDETKSTSPSTESTNAPEESTNAPEGESTNAPEGESTNAPEGDGTDAPEGESTNAPEGESTNAPEDDGTNAPEGESTNAPEDDGTNAPEGESTNAPEGESTNAPEGESTNAPEDDGTNAPEGDGDPDPAPEAMTEEKWRSLFAFENVRISMYAGEELGTVYSVDGNAVYAEGGYGEGGYAPASSIAVVDFSDSYDAFSEQESGVWVAPSLTVEEDLLEMELLNVTVTVENGVITSIRYTVDIGFGITMEQSLLFEDHGKVVLDLTDEERAALDVIATLNAFFEGDALKNYTLVTTTVDEGTTVTSTVMIDGAIYRLVETVTDAEGTVTLDPVIAGASTAAMQYADDAFSMLYIDLDYSVLRTGEESGCYVVDAPMELYTEDADYAIASNIAFELKDGMLVSLTYDAAYYLYAEEEGDADVLMGEAHVEKRFSDYGTTSVEADPIPEGAYASAIGLLEGGERTVAFYQFDMMGMYSLEIVYAADGTYSYVLDDYGKEYSEENASGVQESFYNLFDFVDFLTSLAEEDFILGSDGAYYYLGEATYCDLSADCLSVYAEGGALEVSFSSDLLEVMLSVIPAGYVEE